jgi:phosphate transport system substrate-binding protein
MSAIRRREALALAAALPAMAALRPASAQTSILLRGAGATFPAPLYEAWIKAFVEERKELSIDYDAVGSGEGISRFVSGSVDFAGTDAVPGDEIVGSGAKVIPATAGMVVLAYNLPGIDRPLKLGREVYPAILSGEIDRWDDPRIAADNPGIVLPKRTITLVARLDNSGTTFALTQNLSAVSQAWRDRFGTATRVDWPGNAMLMRGNDGVAGRLRITDGGIGYVEYGFARRLGLAMAELQNKAGAFVAPSATSGREALAGAPLDGTDLRLVVADPPGPTAYPIATYSWLLLYGSYADEAKRQALVEFVRYGLDKGQEAAEAMGYIPLPAAVAEAALRALEIVS